MSALDCQRLECMGSNGCVGHCWKKTRSKKQPAPEPEQPAQQEPVAWGNLIKWFSDSDRVLITDKAEAAKYHRDVYDLTPLYTRPQARESEQHDRVRELECVIADLKTECQELRAAQQEPVAWPIETNDQVEALTKHCGWDNRRYMTPADYQIWCDNMRRFASLAHPQAREPLTDEQKDAARWRFLVDNSFDKDCVTQFHVWEHSWEPHSQTGEPTEWKQRVRGPALDRFIDRAIEAKLKEKNGITGEKK